MTEPKYTHLVLDRKQLNELLHETGAWLQEHGFEGLFAKPGGAYNLLTRWLSLQLAIPGAPGAKDATLPETREELADFFGGIRDAQGRVITGVFVEAALAYLTATKEDA